MSLRKLILRNKDVLLGEHPIESRALAYVCETAFRPCTFIWLRLENMRCLQKISSVKEQISLL